MSLAALHDVPAPAKLNLFLHVVGRREDGYHLLQSVFALIDWCDVLHFERRVDGRLARHDLGAALPADDLCLRAARALQQRSACAFGADISIDKRVPHGAGLGGGSSDAATTLLALNRLWNLHWPRSRLAALALELGADVPFFIGGRNAWVEGIGERLTPIELAPARWVVLKPAATVSTASVFRALGAAPYSAAATIADFATRGAGFGRNDLQDAAALQCGEVTQALALLRLRYGCSRMSGSGSAVFAPAGHDEGGPASLELAGLPAGWIARSCTGLAEHPLAGWASEPGEVCGGGAGATGPRPV